MNPRPALFVTVALALAAWAFTGCLSRPVTDHTRYFVLSPRAASAPAPPPGANTNSIGLTALELPAYLNQPLLVIRKNANELRYAEIYRWSERLDRGIQRVLAMNLRQLLGSDRVRVASWTRDAVSYELRVTLHRFELMESGGAVLEASWQVRQPRESLALASGHRVIEKATPPALADPAGGVAALSEALAELSQDIARSLAAL